MGKYCVGQDIDDNMAHAHCMLGTEGYKCTLKIILIAFPLQQWLQEHASILRYTYIVCFVMIQNMNPFGRILSVNIYCKSSFNVAVTFLTITTSSKTN